MYKRQGQREIKVWATLAANPKGAQEATARGRTGYDEGVALKRENDRLLATTREQLRNLQNTFLAVRTDIGDVFLPVLLEMAKWIRSNVIPVLKRFAEFMRSLSDNSVKMIAALTGIAVVAGPIVVALTVMAAIVALVGAKVLLIVAAIIAFASALAALIVYKKRVMTFFTAIYDAAVMNSLPDYLKETWGELRDFTKDVWDKIAGFVEAAWNRVKVVYDKVVAVKEAFFGKSESTVPVIPGIKTDKVDDVKRRTDALNDYNKAASALFARRKQGFVGEFASDFTSSFRASNKVLDDAIQAKKDAVVEADAKIKRDINATKAKTAKELEKIKTLVAGNPALRDMVKIKELVVEAEKNKAGKEGCLLYTSPSPRD